MISLRTLQDAAARAMNCPTDPEERYAGLLISHALAPVQESDEYAKTEGAIIAALVALVREQLDLTGEVDNKAQEAAADIEHAYRFNDPERYRDAFRALTGHLLHA